MFSQHLAKEEIVAKTLGSVLHERRAAMRMNQRDLAALLGIKASHVAYLEKGRRRPSLRLMKKITEITGLNGRELLFLTHPESRVLMRRVAEETKRDTLKEFVESTARIHKVNPTGPELKFLKSVSNLGHVGDPKSFVHIINAIRTATAK